MLYKCKSRKTEGLEKYVWNWVQVPKFANLAVAPYSGYNYDVALKYYYRNKAPV